MKFEEIRHIYFVGIGGIGMSALARYFNHLGKEVAGYDRTATNLTNALIEEGMDVHFIDNIQLIPEHFLESIEETLVVYTPAIPKTHSELNFFKSNGFTMLKRSQVLGILSKEFDSIGVAGTHGKTTTTTILAHIFNESIGCNALIGGISANYNSNLILNKESKNVIVEADEFDRSFLTLYPKSAIITSMDADHLDIYDDKSDLVNTFYQFIDQIEEDGNLVHKYGLSISPGLKKNTFTYDLDNEKADFYAKGLKVKDGLYHFSLKTPNGEIKNLKLGVPGLVNVENAIAASAISLIHGVDEEDLRKALASYKGVKRRFEIKILSKDIVFIDDYAHHPEEIKKFLASIKELYPGKKVTGIFQPHLFTRTRDFADDFAQELSVLDRLILLDIYPAREEPIPGINSEMLLEKVQIKQKELVDKEKIFNVIRCSDIEVLVTMGAGDIDKLVEPIYNILTGLHQINRP